MFVLSLQKLCLHLKPHNDLRFHILQDKKGVRHQANKNVNLLNTTYWTNHSNTTYNIIQKVTHRTQQVMRLNKDGLKPLTILSSPPQRGTYRCVSAHSADTVLERPKLGISAWGSHCTNRATAQPYLTIFQSPLTLADSLSIGVWKKMPQLSWDLKARLEH